MAVRAPRHNGLLQPQPQLGIPTPEASLVTPLCLSCAANSLLASRTGKSGNIRSLARSLARRLCRRCRGRTDVDGRTDGTDARTDRRVSAPRAHGSRHRRTHCVCVTSFAANGRTEGTGDGGRKGGCFHGKVAVPPPSSVRPSVRPSLHLMIVVATAVVTVVVSAVVTAERSKARVSRSALNYVPSGRAREGGSRGERGSSQVERERERH